MSIKSFLESVIDDGLNAMTANTPKIRYAVVGLGDIAQVAMLPGIAHTGNSEVTAFVTGDAVKARELGDKYGVENTYSYDQFGELLQSGLIDAIYLATPNWLHAEFAVQALRAGIHVLLEKPMEITTARCQEILDAQKQSNAKLMVAYRLHFEPSTLDAITRIRNAELGLLRTFTSTFSQLVNPANHRAKNGALAGPLFDMGPYPVNAARYVFGDEPTEVVSAVAVTHADLGMPDLQDTITATLRFPGDKLATFTVSYAAAGFNAFVVQGTKGALEMNPSFTYGEPLIQHWKIDGTVSTKSFPVTDQFGGEMKYFSNCIINDLEVEPNGEEGFADVRVLEGIQQAIMTCQPVKLPAFTHTRRIDTDKQSEELGGVPKPKRVNVTSPSIR